MDAVITSYSQRFLDFLSREDGALCAAMKPAVDATGKPTGFLLAEVQPPNPRASAPLWIRTEDDEITVGFDAFHTHFSAWDESTTEAQSFVGALTLARDIMAERALVASWWLEEKWSGSQLVEPGFKPERPEYVAGSAAARVRSWTGARDQ
ncbi:MAG TPA: hypothetical protein VG734_20250 [Lacunisphaera sp.]|nr:hypothetical protein [Lacunisphaera sp.]